MVPSLNARSFTTTFQGKSACGPPGADFPAAGLGGAAVAAVAAAAGWRSQCSAIQRWSAPRSTATRGARTPSWPTVTARVRRSTSTSASSTRSMLASGSPPRGAADRPGPAGMAPSPASISRLSTSRSAATFSSGGRSRALGGAHCRPTWASSAPVRRGTRYGAR